MARTIETWPLHRAIEDLEDDALILKLYAMMGISPQQCREYHLTDTQKDLIAQSEEEIDRGESHSSEEVVAMARKWLAK